MKRFYTSVAVAEAGTGARRILLDGRPVRTPGRVPLELATAALAEAVAAEWRAQGDTVVPRSMPLTSLASTSTDRVRPLRDGVTAQLVRFIRSELVCYRAETPEDLVARQEACWQPLVDWFAQRFDAPLRVVRGVMPEPQPDAAHRAAAAALEALDADALTTVSCAAAAAGSLVLALALVEGRLDAEATAAAAQLDEIWQAERWGDDPQAAERRAAVLAEIDAAARYFALTRA
ncbi:MAG: ATP12 family protein [Alphaproteobacteria bacterium]